MYLVQLLLPVRNEGGRPFLRSFYDDLAHELTERFGGVTAHTRAPAAGLWEEEAGRQVHDDVVIYEVMVEELEESWCSALRGRIDRELEQEELVIRAHQVRRL